MKKFVKCIKFSNSKLNLEETELMVLGEWETDIEKDVIEPFGPTGIFANAGNQNLIASFGSLNDESMKILQVFYLSIKIQSNSKFSDLEVGLCWLLVNFFTFL